MGEYNVCIHYMQNERRLLAELIIERSDLIRQINEWASINQRVDQQLEIPEIGHFNFRPQELRDFKLVIVQNLRNFGQQFNDIQADIQDLRLRIREGSGSQRGGSSEIQSVLFLKSYGWTQKEASDELKKMGIKPIKQGHVTKNMIRYRVRNVNNNKYFYRTKWLSENDGIKAVIQINKS